MSPREETRTALLKAAREEFAAYGIAGARVDRIAEKAGVNKERIYGYFGSKEKLFDAVIREALDELTAAVAMPGADPVEYVGKIFDFHRTNPDLLRLEMWEALHYRDDELPGRAARVDACGRKVASLAAGLGREVSPDVARTMLSLISLAVYPLAMPTLARVILGDAGDPEAMRRHVMDFARRSLAVSLEPPRPR